MGSRRSWLLQHRRNPFPFSANAITVGRRKHYVTKSVAQDSFSFRELGVMDEREAMTPFLLDAKATPGKVTSRTLSLLSVSKAQLVLLLQTVALERRNDRHVRCYIELRDTVVRSRSLPSFVNVLSDAH